MNVPAGFFVGRRDIEHPSRQGARQPNAHAYFGLTPKKYQSGEADRDGGVSKVGDGCANPCFLKRSISC
jgi:hypothetical protein